MGVSTRVTYSDLLRAGPQPMREERYEILDGELYVVPAPDYDHQSCVQNLYVLLHPVARRLKGKLIIAPFDVVLHETDYVQPDLVYVRRDNPAFTRRGIQGAPDLVIEVLSPSTRDKDLTLKRKRYEKRGVRELWYVDPRAWTVEVLVRGEKSYRQVGEFTGKNSIPSTVLGQLRFPVEKIFEGVGEYD